MATDTTELKRWHARLTEAREILINLAGEGMGGAWPPGISSDTVHAIGLAEGILSKATALIGRDIDDAPLAEPEPPLHRSGLR